MEGVTVVALAGMLFLIQSQVVAQAVAPAASAPDSTAVRATLATEAPVLDGKDDESVWRLAPSIDRFRVSRPSEGAQPRYRTEARVAYDARHLYVFVRAYDPHPDSIISLLARRDEYTSSDQVTLMSRRV